jgi:hypothetical protein
MRLQDIIMREAPSAYIFESDGSVHRQRSFEDEESSNGAQFAVGKRSVVCPGLKLAAWKISDPDLRPIADVLKSDLSSEILRYWKAPVSESGHFVWSSDRDIAEEER